MKGLASGSLTSLAAGVVLTAVVTSGCARERAKPSWMSDGGTTATTNAELKANTPDIRSTCTKICEHSRVLRCQNASECELNCVAMATGTPCNSEFRALYGCLLQQPAANWECAEDGIAAVREGFCEAQQQSAVSCMQAKAH
jgi:hypothetical protein